MNKKCLSDDGHSFVRAKYYHNSDLATNHNTNAHALKYSTELSIN